MVRSSCSDQTIVQLERPLAGDLVGDGPDDRSAMAIALGWVSRITTLSVVMVAPGILGYVVDRQLGTVALFTIVGMALGMVLGMWSLLRATRTARSED